MDLRAVRILFAACLISIAALSSGAAEPPLKDRPHLRRPIAAAWIESGKLLAVANQRSGTVSIVDIPARKVLDEIAVGERLADISPLPGSGRLLVIDEKRHELIMLRRGIDNQLSVEDRMEVSPYPVSLAVSPDSSFVTIASLWTRKLSVWSYARSVPRHEIPYLLRGEVTLSFNPRLQFMLPDQRRAVVADAFGKQVALVNLMDSQIIAEQSLAGHNLRGMAIGRDPQCLVISQQLLSRAAATPANLKARLLIENVVGEYCLPGVTSRDQSLIPGRIHPLGNADSGQGDLGAVRHLNGDRILVAVSGGNDLALLPEMQVPPYESLPVGRRPTIIAFFDAPAAGWSPDQPPVYPAYREPEPPCDVVLNSFSDSLSFLAWNDKEPRDVVESVGNLRLPRPVRKGEERPLRGNYPHIVDTIPLGPVAGKSPADRGEELFYDAKLSAGGWMSCHSCHTDGHTNGQLADTLSDGTYGTPKRIPTLLGTRLTDKWAWNGEVRELHEQVQKSLENTMHAPKFSPQDVLDITAFLHTLPPPPPLQPATKAPADIAQLARGEALFGQLGCAKCHVPPLTYTSPEVYDVGLEDEKGLKKFNPPSLRGVSQGYSLFHDGRAKTLEAVFTEHAHQLDRPLEKDELADLLRFLRSL